MPVPLGNLGINATMGPSYMLANIILTLWENLGGHDGDESEGFIVRTKAFKAPAQAAAGACSMACKTHR